MARRIASTRQRASSSICSDTNAIGGTMLRWFREVEIGPMTNANANKIAIKGKEQGNLAGYLFLNESSDAMTNGATEDFIGRIEKELQNGFGFVPFIGAGFSAPSGIPLVCQLRTYLQRCICMALGAEQRGMRPWNPRMENWPPFIDRTRAEPANGWMGQVESELKHLREKEPKNRDLPVYQEGYGAMAEW